MLLDMGEFTDGQELSAAVCIVGAGPTGIALASELDAGTPTIVVESGDVLPTDDTDRLNHGQSVGIPGVGMESGRSRALGGTSRLWAGQCLPLDPIDFERRGWIADSGWPVSHAEMQPYLARAAGFFEVDGEPYDERVWRPFGLTPPAFDPSRLRHLATVYTPQPDLGARFGKPFERSDNVRVLLRATATKLETDESGKTAAALQATGLDGRRVRIRARAFVLCAGAIENARLLLLSDGPGNDRDLVGRFFQDHPNAHVATVETASPRALLDRYSLLYRKPLRYFPKIGVSPELQRDGRLLNGIANLIFDFGDDSGVEAVKRIYRARRDGRRPAAVGRDLLRVGRDVPQLLRDYRRFRQGLSPAGAPERIVLQVHTEQAPDRGSRVTLGDEVDALGIPVARVDWRIGRQEVDTARALTAAVGEELDRLGLGKVDAADWLADAEAATGFGGAYHHLARPGCRKTRAGAW
jgi:hypothetical protein